MTAGDMTIVGAVKRVLMSRIGVVFSDVTRQSGYFERFTIYFKGRKRQVMGAVDTYGKRGDVHTFDDQPYDPGYELTYEINKRAEFGDDVRTRDLGADTIEHTSAPTRRRRTSRPTAGTSTGSA
jgi:hypothetical protein